MKTDFSKILFKSDFKVARSCPSKLYYKKNGYPSANDGNKYMEYLAQGGYAVCKLATLHFPKDSLDISAKYYHLFRSI